ncbi:MAG: L,D-transpeptidase [Desulfosarcina sp.]|nr:L,D-transpeptidase [Desulfobacterales bacterium]
MISGRLLTPFKFFFILSLCLTIETNIDASSGEPADYGRIPDVLIGFHSENSKAYALLVEKAAQRLYFYNCSDDFTEMFSMECSTGKMSGAKSISGDKKTPEGVYFFTNKFSEKYLSERYGVKAFPMDYPNFLDRVKGRNGYSIWLHGTDKPLRSRNSNGCVTLQDSDLEKLSEYITLNRTPIIILENLSYISDDSRKKAERWVLNFLNTWKDTLLGGTYHQYLSLYDPEYLPEIAWWTEWNKMRSSFITSGRSFNVELKNTSILKFDSVYVVLSDLIVEYDNIETWICKKKIFIADQPGRLKVVGEEYQSIPENFKKGSHSTPLTTACGNIIKRMNIHKEIPAMIDGWLKAWSEKNIKEYGKYYAEDFLSKGISKKRWLRQKNALNRKYKYIKVKKDDLKINQSKGMGRVSFLQTYQSDTYRAVGRKKLLLKLEKGEWKIYRETWTRM